MTSALALGFESSTGPSQPNIAGLASELQSLAAADGDYWSFVDRGNRDYMHSLLRYPAMMVPKLQRELLETCLRWDPSIASVYDPFVGSGTVMTEAMLLGRDFVGTDINPLAILTCRAKSEFLDSAALDRDLRRLFDHINCDSSTHVETEFRGLDKWFIPTVAIGLSKLRRAIVARPFVRTRRFWWVVMAEVIRLVSNSRTSTSKLHLRPVSEVVNRPDPVLRFREVAERSVGVVALQETELAAQGLIVNGKYKGRVDVSVADARNAAPSQSDLLMSSPPYGDNHTTVTYGQASFLPLQWIQASDISHDVDPRLMASTHATDTASLGGSKRVGLTDNERVLDRSATLRRTCDAIVGQPRDRRIRVITFFRDFDVALDRIVDNLRPGAIMLWTVGDRSVGGQRIPFALILRQLLGSRADYVTDLSRSIPTSSKRMPARNAVTDTMASETILIMRKSLAL